MAGLTATEGPLSMCCARCFVVWSQDQPCVLTRCPSFVGRCGVS